MTPTPAAGTEVATAGDTTTRPAASRSPRTATRDRPRALLGVVPQAPPSIKVEPTRLGLSDRGTSSTTVSVRNLVQIRIIIKIIIHWSGHIFFLLHSRAGAAAAPRCGVSRCPPLLPFNLQRHLVPPPPSAPPNGHLSVDCVLWGGGMAHHSWPAFGARRPTQVTTHPHPSTNREETEPLGGAPPPPPPRGLTC
jgi:hypothetical protein